MSTGFVTGNSMVEPTYNLGNRLFSYMQ
uniref:Uncharacterized protein n=1 Tax=Arundo donax TaxID=35708 RepID=A0A0A9AU63_ARUDO